MNKYNVFKTDDKEGVIGLLEHLILCEGVIHLVLLYYHFLPQDFYGVQFFGGFVPAENYLPKCTLPQKLQKCKVLKRLQLINPLHYIKLNYI